MGAVWVSDKACARPCPPAECEICGRVAVWLQPNLVLPNGWEAEARPHVALPFLLQAGNGSGIRPCFPAGINAFYRGQSMQSPSNPLDEPIINSPYAEPQWHWDLDERGVARAPALPGRRLSKGILPVPKAKGDHTQEHLFDAAPELALVNHLRREVGGWRAQGYPGITNATGKLLRHWSSNQTEPRLFFAQREAIETIVYLQEVTDRKSFAWAELKEANRKYNDSMTRLAVKMATGTGKTTVMALVIVWQAVNHFLRPADQRFTNQFAIITPGITVRDRNAKDLIPQPDGRDMYREWRLLPNDRNFTIAVNSARVEVTNYHALQPQEVSWGAASTRAKKLARMKTRLETDREMMQRALPGLDGQIPILALNDEGHHCHNTDPETVKASREEAKVADVWFNGLRAMEQSRRLAWVLDLSATPMFITKSAGGKGSKDEIFPWTVSDFPLTDAIESGMVKIPRVPVADDVRDTQGPIFRNLYANSTGKTRQRPDELTNPLGEGLTSLYREYEAELQRWQDNGTDTPPVFIIVANDIVNSSAIFDFVAGYQSGADSPWQPGNLPALSNIDDDAQLRSPLRTILIHSRLDDEGQISSRNLIGYLKWQSQAFAKAYPEATRGLNANEIMRSVLNSVGRKGYPGEFVRCVVSVSMLTEGWDTRTVKHVLGFRRFGTQLLCEQVAGRSLRRVAYDNFDKETQRFPAEYADIFGIPFSFAFDRSTSTDVPPPLPTYEVKRLPDRGQYRIVWPNITGYWLNLAGYDRLTIDWDGFEPFEVSATSPQTTELEAITGQTLTISSEKNRDHTALFRIAHCLVERLQEQEGNEAREQAMPLRRARIFQSAVASLREGVRRGCIKVAPDMMWAAAESPHVDALVQHLLQHTQLGVRREKPTVVANGQTPAFLTTGDIHPYWSSRSNRVCTRKSELNLAPCDNHWEATVAYALDASPKVKAWVRNDRQRWQIPYMHKGLWVHYEPDFVARIERTNGRGPLYVVVEVKGHVWPSDPDKRRYVNQYWIPAVNASPAWSQHGPWCYLHIDNPDSALLAIDRIAAA